MSRHDDDFIDPFKLIIGFFKVVFKIIELLFKFIKLIHDGLTSPHWHVRIGTFILVCLIATFIGACIYMSNLEMQRGLGGVNVPVHKMESFGGAPAD